MGWFSKATKGLGGFLFDSPQKDAMKANLGNERLIKSTYQSLWPVLQGGQAMARQQALKAKKVIGEGTDEAIGAIGRGASAARLSARDAITQGVGGAEQELVSSGMYDSSSRAVVRSAGAASLARAYSDIEESTANMLSSALFQKAGMEADAENGIGGVAMNSNQQNLAWGQGFAGTLGGIQHVGGPSLFEQLMMTGAKAAGAKAGMGGL